MVHKNSDLFSLIQDDCIPFTRNNPKVPAFQVPVSWGERDNKETNPWQGSDGDKHHEGKQNRAM